MKIEKIIENVEKSLKDISIEPDNVIQAITKLLEITHAHGLDNEAIAALATCGITLEIKEA